jgi:hypothetical protein
LTKITAIIIMSLAALAAIVCLLFKIKINPHIYDSKSLKSKFFVAISIMMAFFAGFFTSCKTQDQAIAGSVTPAELSVSKSTPKASVTPGHGGGHPHITCYMARPLRTPAIDPNVPTPVCYTVVPQNTPEKKSSDKHPRISCYKPALLSTPEQSPTVILCYEPVMIPSKTPSDPHSRPACYAPVPGPTSYKSDSDIRDSKLALLEEISKKNTVKEDLLNRVKENILRNS